MRHKLWLLGGRLAKALVRPMWTPKFPQLTFDSMKYRFKIERNYYFDISKAGQIFDLLLTDKVIQLPERHVIPHVE